jgi:hypothetical protein
LTEECADAAPEPAVAETIEEPAPAAEAVPIRERRVVGERRTNFATFGGTERRTHPFGRRAQDRN